MAQAAKNPQTIQKAVFNLMRRLPPNQVAKSLAGVGQLIEDEEFKQQLFDQIDQPLGKLPSDSIYFAVFTSRYVV